MALMYYQLEMFILVFKKAYFDVNKEQNIRIYAIL